MAQPDPYLGVRCSENELIDIRPDGLGFNEHTVCTWQDGPTVKTYSLHGTIDCQNVYVLDNGTTEVTDETTRHLRLVMVHDTDLDVYLDQISIGRFGACG